jgi:RNA 2',3'-cyclic 3'-phosphodiesterase
LSGEPTRRLFFALWPDEEQRAALAHAVRKAVRACGGRPVPGANVHLTLAFLGSVPQTRAAELSDIARRTAAGFPREAVPLRLTLERLAHFGQAQVLAADATRDAPLEDVQALARALAAETAAAGFSPDLKPFRPHVTVARKVTRAPRSSAMRPVEWRFDSFALIESRTLETGPVYSVVESYALSDSEKLRA